MGGWVALIFTLRRLMSECPEDVLPLDAVVALEAGRLQERARLGDSELVGLDLAAELIHVNEDLRQLWSLPLCKSHLLCLFSEQPLQEAHELLVGRSGLHDVTPEFLA